MSSTETVVRNMTMLYHCADLRVRHLVEIRRHADVTGGKCESEYAPGLRTASVARSGRGGEESCRRGDQEGTRARYAAAHCAAHQNSVVTGVQLCVQSAYGKCQV